MIGFIAGHYITFDQMGRDAGLTGSRLTEYVNFMDLRYASQERDVYANGLAKEWAERFLEKKELVRADPVSVDIFHFLKKRKMN